MIWIIVAWIVLAFLISSGVAAWNYMDFRGWWLMFLFYLAAIPVGLFALWYMVSGVMA